MVSTTSETAPGIKPTPIQKDSPNDKMWPKIEQDSTCIRVLEVLPSGGGKKGDSAIECLFHLVDVETTDLTYDTLSYVWGAGPATKAIRINGHERPVRENVYAALAKLRRETDSYFVWIDAVCINQADDEEKTHEVNLMQRIFARSASKRIFVFIIIIIIIIYFPLWLTFSAWSYILKGGKRGRHLQELFCSLNNSQASLRYLPTLRK